MNGGLVEHSCVGSVNEVLARLLIQLEVRGVQLFAVIDHGDAARKSELELPDEVVAIFGNPALGTKFMQDDARTGIDLPLRILIWDDGGTTKLAYDSPSHLVDRYALDPSRLPVGKLDELLEDLSASISH